VGARISERQSRYAARHIAQPMKAKIASSNLSQDMPRAFVAQDCHGVASDNCNSFYIVESGSHFASPSLWRRLRRFDKDHCKRFLSISKRKIAGMTKKMHDGLTVYCMGARL